MTVAEPNEACVSSPKVRISHTGVSSRSCRRLGPGLELPCRRSRQTDPITFEDVAVRAGVEFVLQNSATPARRQIEPMVSGVAIFDYNGDGKPDLYFVNGARQPQLDKPDPSYYNRLYRNNGDGTFTDVTLAAGVRGDGFATGVAAADFDNDGWADLFIAGVNRNILYRNRGDGTFTDVTAAAGLAQPAGVRNPGRFPQAGSITITTAGSICSW